MGQSKDKIITGLSSDTPSKPLLSTRDRILAAIQKRGSASAIDIMPECKLQEARIHDFLGALHHMGVIYIERWKNVSGAVRNTRLFAVKTSPDQQDALPPIRGAHLEEYMNITQGKADSQLKPNLAGSRTLAILRACRKGANREELSNMLGVQRKSVNRHILSLRTNGLLAPMHPHGYYKTTEAGEKYLADSRKVNENPKDGAQFFSTLLNAPRSETPIVRSEDDIRSFRNRPVYVANTSGGYARPGAGDFANIRSRGAF